MAGSTAAEAQAADAASPRAPRRATSAQPHSASPAPSAYAKPAACGDARPPGPPAGSEELGELLGELQTGRSGSSCRAAFRDAPSGGAANASPADGEPTTFAMLSSGSDVAQR